MINNLEILREKIKEEMNTNSNLETNSTLKILSNYTGNDWKKYIKLDDNKYSKIKVCEENSFDMFVITWNKYQQSPIHDHSSNGCIYKIMKGNLEETIFNKKLEWTHRKNMQENCSTYISDKIGYHSIKNINNDISVSLHIYSPPGYITNYFN